VEGDAHLEALGEVAGADDEVLGGDRRADLLCGLLEQRQPTVEMRLTREAFALSELVRSKRRLSA
jgi:hypothetical protein